MTETREFRLEVMDSIFTLYPEWEAKEKDEFAISIKANDRDGYINLHNLYNQTQRNRGAKQVLIQQFLSEFAEVIGNTKNSLDDFESVKKNISLVVRPTDLFSESLEKDNDKQLAFSIPVLPDLALYWVIDNANSWQYITNAHFSKWNVSSSEVTWWAYKNTCKAEKCMKTAEIHESDDEIGLMISTSRKEGTIAHLLYEPANLQMLIHSTYPSWSKQPYWVCIPVPGLMIIVKEGHNDIIQEMSPIAYEHYGKVLSNRIYVFNGYNFTQEVMHNTGQKEPIMKDLGGCIPEVVLPD